MLDLAGSDTASRPSTYVGLALSGLNITPPLSEKVFNEMFAATGVESNFKKTKEEKAMTMLLQNLPILNDHFVLHRKIGEGTYSTVYLASYKNSKSQKQFAVKHLTDNFSLPRIQKELHFMQMIGGHDNVVNVLNCFKNGSKDCIVFVMPYLQHKRFSEYVLDMDVEELRLYMKNLLMALRRVHSFNVIHRDVKPGNFLYCRETKKFFLVDFGLAQEVSIMTNRKTCKLENNEENLPINYSKRKRPCNDDVQMVSKKPGGLTPLQSRENIILGYNNTLSPETRTRTPDLFLRLKNRNGNINDGALDKVFSPSFADLKHKCHDLSLKRSSGLNYSRKRQASSLLHSSTDSKLACTPKSSTSDYSKTFTPLVGSVPVDSFVVRNSQVLVSEDSNSSCVCRGTASICSACALKRPLTAPRAGTPGFRPPEVLLRCVQQTTAVDMWAAGVVLLCVLSGTYPFFKSTSDLAALMEIMTIFGTESIERVAVKCGRNVPSSSFRSPLDLQKVCRRRRARFSNITSVPAGKCQKCLQIIREDDCACYMGPISCSNSIKDGDQFPDSAYHLLWRLLDVDPESRITAEEALSHPFISQV